MIVSLCVFQCRCPRRSAMRYLRSGEDVDIPGAPFVSRCRNDCLDIRVAR